MSLYSMATLTKLKEKMPDYLQEVCDITNLRRPFHCLSPSHEDRNPSMSYDSRRLNVHCFSCGASGDVFEVAGWVEGAIDFPAKVEAVARAVDFCLETKVQTPLSRPARTSVRAAYAPPQPLKQINLINDMQKAIWTLLGEPQAKGALDYLHGRGFDDQLIADSYIGWIEHPSEMIPNMKARPCDGGYLVLGFPEVMSWEEGAGGFVKVPYAAFRMCAAEATPKELKPSGLTAPLWREYLLHQSHEPYSPLYVVEGVFDAMSLKALLDLDACALCGASGTNRFLQIMAHVSNNLPNIVLALDSDEAGAQMTETISKGLKELGVPHEVAEPYPQGCKDANEYLMLERGHHV